MRVLQVINSLETGGAEKLILDTVPLLIKKGVKVDVLLLCDKSTPFYQKLYSQNLCSIYTLGQSIYNPFYFFKIISFLRKYQVVHVHLFPSLYFVALAKLVSFTKSKLVFTEHSTNNKRLSMPIFRIFDRFIYRQYNTIICISEQVKDVLVDKLHISTEKLLVINNGINISDIKSSVKGEREKFKIDKNHIILIMVAAFRVEKDQDTVLHALSKLSEKYMLILVGDGERKKELKSLVTQLGIESRVLFLGIRTDVYSLLKMSDIAILSSHWEGFGIAAAEAMASETPLIASKVEGLLQVVENGGVLFNKGDVEDLINEIKRMDDAEYYHNISKQGVLKASQFDISIMIDKLYNLYTQV